MEANQQEKEYGKIEQVALVSHAGPDHGPIFEYGTPRQDQLTTAWRVCWLLTVVQRHESR
jgi:hypothetical protein